ncbi:putative disease resistance RPP13-like protein 1 isoform X3 [Ziziphus jujuba]|uniref:Disease resistance RPP13-like protein 1 isoform X3 n=1 Tax=Ziziphus jujuba TaxID=326968 RepID=A0ABM4A283_ZIZJJ|nr:putative disease resistance RPP13-like protein 1 isoform X3 [Ziziphus jujuba]
MDPATVGAHFLSEFLEVSFAKIAKPAFLGCLGIAKLKAEDFTKMKMMFSSANLVLNDAEQQQITNPIARKWLDDLQEVIYDIRDLMDRIEAAKIYGNVGLNEEITEILIKLENIANQKNHLGLKSGVQNTILPRPQTTSLVEDSGVYGRDADKETIMELLLSNEMNGKKIFVGMSGIGKTALAQLIYSEIDNKVMEKPFDFKAWVCVTNEFSIFKITKTIAKRVITSLKFEDDDDLDFIQV